MKERQDRLFELWQVIIFILFLLFVSVLCDMSLDSDASFAGSLCCGALDLILIVVFYDFRKPKN